MASNRSRTSRPRGGNRSVARVIEVPMYPPERAHGHTASSSARDTRPAQACPPSASRGGVEAPRPSTCSAKSSQEEDHNIFGVTKLPQVQHRGEFFRPGFISLLIIGRSGTGKTEFLKSVLPQLSPAYKTAVLATVMANVPAHNSIMEILRRQGMDVQRTDSPEELRRIMKRGEESGEISLSRPALLLADDFNDGRPHSPYFDALSHMWCKGRNMGWSMVVVGQRPSLIPPIIRSNCNIRVLFDVYSSSALSHFLSDFKDRVADKGVLEQLVRLIRDVPFSYLMCREQPFEVCAGSLDKFKPVMDANSVKVPSLEDIRTTLGASTNREAAEKAKGLEREAGNTGVH